MLNQDEYEPAFPQDATTGNMEFWRHGMALRDYFAAHAAACIWHHNFLAFSMTANECQEQIQNAAVLSYRIADAMLEVRNGVKHAEPKV